MTRSGFVVAENYKGVIIWIDGDEYSAVHEYRAVLASPSGEPLVAVGYVSLAAIEKVIDESLERATHYKTAPCMLVVPHVSHHWWYTSSGGGHMLREPILLADLEQEKDLQRLRCPGRTP